MIPSIISAVTNIIDKVITDKDKANEAKVKALELAQQGELNLISNQSQIITTEAQSESWMARNWRPITMLVFVSIIANNYLIAPYLAVFGLPHTILQLPERIWSLMEIGLGGYIASRGVEKVAQVFKK